MGPGVKLGIDCEAMTELVKWSVLLDAVLGDGTVVFIIIVVVILMYHSMGL